MVAHLALAARPRRSAVVLGILALLALTAVILSPRPGPASANPLTGLAAVATGGEHTCALTTAGGVKCWGNNRSGELGDGTGGNLADLSATPVDVVELTSGAVAVSAGSHHTCALTTAGGVKCWGLDVHEQLGDDESCGYPYICPTPVDVVGLSSGVASVAAGNSHTCALTTAGGVKCWGWNDYGELGDETTIPRPTPADVVGLGSGVASIATGNSHTCALTTAGGVQCWGDNRHGQLGDGTGGNLGDFSTIPVGVVGLGSGVVAVAAGGKHTCALTTAGGVKCWGLNSSGQLGDGTTTGRTSAVRVSGLSSGVAAVAAGESHTCAITTAGGAKCWGDNSFGQLGDAQSCGVMCPMLVDVAGLGSGVAAIAAGGLHTCALTAASAVRCWGLNALGQLGDGTTTGHATPVDVVVALKPEPGDASCDATVNSIDAALVLQYVAGLLGSLACQQNADVNGDGSINSIDAALILQYDAGLIGSLPP